MTVSIQDDVDWTYAV